MRKYKVLLAIFFVFLVLGIGELIYYWTLINKQKAQSVIKDQTTVQTQPPPSGKLPPIEMAKKALDCLETTRDERGAFVAGVECDENSQCKKTASSNHTGHYVMWGRTKYIEKTNDQKELEILRKDVEFYLDEKNINMIQPNFVSKMFLYEMWQSKIFSEVDKEKIKALAKRFSTPELATILPAQQYAWNSNYQRPDFASLIAGKKGDGKIQIAIENDRDYTETISAASDYIVDYQWFKDPFSLKMAEGLFYGSIEKYFNSDKVSFQNRNLLGLTATQFYQATGEKMFLDFAINIYNHPEIQDPCFSNGSCSGILTVPIVSGIFSDNLYLVTKETKYLELKGKMINYLVKSDLGSTEGCYNNLFPKNDKYKNTMGNGLAVGLLSEEVANE